MHKYVIHKAGSYDKIEKETLPLPPLVKGEGLIEVSYFGVNYAGIKYYHK